MSARGPARAKASGATALTAARGIAIRGLAIRVVTVRRDAAAVPEPRMRLPAPEAARPARKGPAYARRVPHAPHPHKAAAVPLAALPRRRRSNRPPHSDAMREALARARRLLVPFIGAEAD
ncbi:hypothetical protein [Burkholderia pseudomallei]|uniref:hypothetical protein n=1 Tax=Burkholderia pseudomallei TaxID=28450 RepID=UPI0003FD88C7|nr:hypothetical protein [Burkholderia pseudomallei]UZU14288.1 hypothetical protein OSB53_14790 [Burkholderia pseudomallei]UZU22275.1 hypothetical protein OSB35_24695 [Burkholderia pseudomallei]UZU30394.1 hypothetical protein OSB54_18795 [Burkholderia pseudomallei]